MAYRWKRSETVEGAVHRIAHEQIDATVREARDPRLDRDETVHQVRKRCKKLRSLLRLVRACLEPSGTYAAENAAIRDAARRLSGLRDAAVLPATLEALRAHYADAIEDDAFEGLRRSLADRRQRLRETDGEGDRRLEEVLGRLTAVRDRVASWQLSADGFDAVEGGLAKTYRRARKAMAAAYRDPTAERFHEWRKRVKIHGHHVCLLRSVWKDAMKARRRSLDALSELLGSDHDLSVLRATPFGEGDEPKALELLLGLAVQRQVEFRRRAWTLGARLFAEQPAAWVGRSRRYWEVSRDPAPQARPLVRVPDIGPS